MDELKPGTIALGPTSLRLSYSALVPPNLRGNALEISDLLTIPNERGHNHANSLMQDVCQQADQAGKLLLIMPERYGQDGPTTEELSDWYQRRHGFVVLQLSPKIILVRMPAMAAAKWAGQ
jgi:hypothetical protein